MTDFEIKRRYTFLTTFTLYIRLFLFHLILLPLGPIDSNVTLLLFYKRMNNFEVFLLQKMRAGIIRD